MSEGYCFGHEDESNCTNHNVCKSFEEGGEAVPGDELAYLIYKAMQSNSLLKTYITNNKTIAKIYSDETTDMGGWYQRFAIRHSKDSTVTQPKPLVQTAEGIVSGGNGSDSWSEEIVWEGVYGRVYTNPAGKINIGKIDEVREDKPLGRVQTVTINWSRGSTHAGYNNFTWSCSNPKVQLIAGGGSSWNAANYATFDISRLSMEERQNCIINFNVSAGWETTWHPDVSTKYGTYGYHRYTASMSTSVSTSSTATLGVKRSECFEKGHVWSANVTWNKEYDPLEKKDVIKSATVEYFCSEDVSHVKAPGTVWVNASGENNPYKITMISYPDYDLYTFTSQFVKTEEGTLDSYSTKVFKNGSASTTQTIAFNSTTTSGSLYASNRNDEKDYPGGASSKYAVKRTTAHIDFTVNAGIIQPGVQALNINLSYNNELTDLTYTVYDKRGNPIVQNYNDSAFVNLAGYPDSKLQGAYIKVSASVITEVWTTSPYNLWQPIPEARTSISANSITLYY